MRTFAGLVPGFAIVVHRGRRTDREYRTLVIAFLSPGGFVIALTYGPDRDWVRNVLAAGGCTIEWQGRADSVTPLCDKVPRPYTLCRRPCASRSGRRV